MFRWLAHLWEEMSIPAPPFRACKRTAAIMYGVWYGRLTPEQARKKALEWGFEPESIEEMITESTQPPSYWSRRSDHSAAKA